MLTFISSFKYCCWEGEESKRLNIYYGEITWYLWPTKIKSRIYKQLRSIKRNETEATIKTLPMEKTPGPDIFTDGVYHYLKPLYFQ